MDLPRLTRVLHPEGFKFQEFHGTLVGALTCIMDALALKGYTASETDLRKFGEAGIPRMRSSSGMMRCTSADPHEDKIYKCVFRIHRNPSDIYIIDFMDVHKTERAVRKK